MHTKPRWLDQYLLGEVRIVSFIVLMRKTFEAQLPLENKVYCKQYNMYTKIGISSQWCQLLIEPFVNKYVELFTAFSKLKLDFK